MIAFLRRLFAKREPWQCPNDIAHVYEISIDDYCVGTIKRLTNEPSGNTQQLIENAARYAMQDGSFSMLPPRPGELLNARCVKCGRWAIITVMWAR